MHELVFCKGAHVLTRVQSFAVCNIRHNIKGKKSFLIQGRKKKNQGLGHSKCHVTATSPPTQPLLFQRMGNRRGQKVTQTYVKLRAKGLPLRVSKLKHTEFLSAKQKGRLGRNQQTSQPLQLYAYTGSTAIQPQTWWRMQNKTRDFFTFSIIKSHSSLYFSSILRS